MPARLALLLFLVSGYVWAEAPPHTVVISPAQSRQFSFDEYVIELDQLTSLANRSEADPGAADDAISQLRGGWKVSANRATLSVPTGRLLNQFEALKKGPDEKTRARLLADLALLKADADAYAQSPPDFGEAHSRLNQILARSEFGSVHGPTWLDRLKARIASWLYRLLSHTFGSSAVPTVGKVFVWTLVAIAVVLLAFFLYRALKANSALPSVVPQGMAVSAKEWRLWMLEAHAAAAEGRWRDAVHLAYWAGISFLEAGGMWRPDKARTPREYLRLLPAASEHRVQLSSLTRTLELTWYGNEAAGPETFSQTVTLLEALGCREA